MAIGFRSAIFVVILAILSYGIYKVIYSNEVELDFPKSGYFGRGQPKPDDPKIYPFKINVSEDVLTDLKNRLKNSRIGHEQLEDVPDFEYGFNLATLKQWKDYWLNKFDWRKQENLLNTFPHFTTQIEGLQIHFIHVKPPKSSKYRQVVPLLIVHGWPGSVFEFYKMIPLLVDPNSNGAKHSDVAFEVIAPSIPGYGWSEQPHKKGHNGMATARIFQKLMTQRLNFSRFLAQGGDWGSIVVSQMARMYPENLYGIHLNMLFAGMDSLKGLVMSLVGSFFPSLVFSQPEHAEFSFKRTFFEIIKESGYMHIQATKPDTIGVGLNDSPIGFLAYILEKFSTWTNPAFRELADGGLEKKFTKDELLTNVMIYWVNQNILSSQRYYKENFGSEINQELCRRYVSIPTGYAAYVDDLGHRFGTPIELARLTFNITWMTNFNDGGHFAAFEKPKELGEDIFAFAKTLNIK